MKRELIVGIWGRSGQVQPSCCMYHCDSYGHECRFTNEMDCSVEPDSQQFTTPRSKEDNAIRATVWAFYLAILMTAACAVLLAYWPV